LLKLSNIEGLGSMAQPAQRGVLFVTLLN
jgi:hypothetical protein